MVHRSHEGDHSWAACKSSGGCATTSIKGESEISFALGAKLVPRMAEERLLPPEFSSGALRGVVFVSEWVGEFGSVCLSEMESELHGWPL